LGGWVCGGWKFQLLRGGEVEVSVEREENLLDGLELKNIIVGAEEHRS
jgi:hypothetical protein